MEIFPAYCLAMEGLEALDHLLALYWLHLADREVLRVYPRGDRSQQLVGVFSSRSPLRPYPIGVAQVELLGKLASTIYVRGLDATDGTPLVDLMAAP